MNTASTLLTAAGPHVHTLAASGLFSSGTEVAYMIEGLLAAVALVTGTAGTIGKSHKEGAGSALTNQVVVIALSVTIFLSSGIAAIITHEMASHGVTNHVHVPNPYGQ